jgi:hypothetical protein
VPDGSTDVRYAFCPTYLPSHFGAWLESHRNDPALRVEELCRSRKGRAVALLRAGRLDEPQGVVILTARHHACEAMASYALEGFVSAVLADDALGRRWRSRWQVVAVPFMDTDGVTDGDSGKNRDPHDHNRDYNDKPIYPEVAAMMKLGEGMRPDVVAALDLHCPHIRGAWNEQAYLVGSSIPQVWAGQQTFAAALERTDIGPIPFDRKTGLLAHGQAWNTTTNYTKGRSFGRWAGETFTSARLVTTLELPYANASGVEVNADSARQFGRRLAAALADHLDETK